MSFPIAILPPPEQTTTWNTADKSADIIVSNAGRTFACAVASFRAVRGTPILPAQKIYMEFTRHAGSPIFGIGNASAPLSSYVGSDANSWGWQTANGSKVWHIGSNTAFTGAGDSVDGDLLMIAIDAASQKFWAGRNGTWHNSGSPGAGTGQASFPTTQIPTSGGYLMASVNSVNAALSIARRPTYLVPSGFEFVSGG